MSVYLSVQHVEKIHDVMIGEFGGSKGVRSRELLESAVFRMQTTFGGNELYVDDFEKAAAMLESICRNHAFIDGNKRTAFTAAVTFLEINGHNMEFDKIEAEEMMISVASGNESFAEIVKFLKSYCK
jgi:death-on-curing protein